MNRGVAHGRKESPEDFNFNKCISLQPEWLEAYYNKNTALAILGRYGKTYESITRYKTLDK